MTIQFDIHKSLKLTDLYLYPESPSPKSELEKLACIIFYDEFFNTLYFVALEIPKFFCKKKNQIESPPKI